MKYFCATTTSETIWIFEKQTNKYRLTIAHKKVHKIKKCPRAITAQHQPRQYITIYFIIDNYCCVAQSHVTLRYCHVHWRLSSLKPRTYAPHAFAHENPPLKGELDEIKIFSHSLHKHRQRLSLSTMKFTRSDNNLSFLAIECKHISVQLQFYATTEAHFVY